MFMIFLTGKEARKRELKKVHTCSSIGKYTCSSPVHLVCNGVTYILFFKLSF